MEIKFLKNSFFFLIAHVYNRLSVGLGPSAEFGFYKGTELGNITSLFMSPHCHFFIGLKS